MSAARFFKYWLPIILWMTIIFGASTGLGASQNTSRIIGPILHWLFPNIANDTADNIVFAIRKSSHAIEYAILALLIWRARRKSNVASGVPPAVEPWPPARRREHTNPNTSENFKSATAFGWLFSGRRDAKPSTAGETPAATSEFGFNEVRPWNRREAGLAILFCALYAATDEFHQTFVAARQGSPWDVLLDTSGAAAGMFLLWLAGRWLKRW